MTETCGEKTAWPEAFRTARAPGTSLVEVAIEVPFLTARFERWPAEGSEEMRSRMDEMCDAMRDHARTCAMAYTGSADDGYEIRGLTLVAAREIEVMEFPIRAVDVAEGNDGFLCVASEADKARDAVARFVRSVTETGARPTGDAAAAESLATVDITGLGVLVFLSAWPTSEATVRTVRSGLMEAVDRTRTSGALVAMRDHEEYALHWVGRGGLKIVPLPVRAVGRTMVGDRPVLVASDEDAVAIEHAIAMLASTDAGLRPH